jgi:hypothetical protein
MLGLGTPNKKAPQRGYFCYAVWAGRDVLKSDVLLLHVQRLCRIGGQAAWLNYAERYD